MRLLPLVLLGAGAAFFHTHLTGSVPASNEVVRRAPTEIHLKFSSRPEVPLTSIKLLRADSTAVAVSRTMGASVFPTVTSLMRQSRPAEPRVFA